MPTDISNLSPEEKRDLLALLLREQTGESGAFHPVSRGQQALWYLYRLAPDSPAYNIMCAVSIRSKVDVPAFRRAFQALLNHHAVLRATYHMRHGKIVQKVHEYREVPFEVADASGWDEATLNTQMQAAADQPFDLENGPALRITLFKQAAEKIVLLLVAHHISFDLWCFDLLLDQVLSAYIAEKHGRQVSLPDPVFQYTDYIHWQEEMLAGPVGERLWAYWQKQLSEAPPALQLPTDRPYPPVQTFNGATHSFKLSDLLVERIKELALMARATPYMTLLAVFQILLYRYSGQEDIVVGSPVAGRTRAGLEDIIGYFVNPIVLRADLSSNPTFAIFLEQVRRRVLAGLEHQDFPFSVLVEWLQSVRDPGRPALFQVAFNWIRLRHFTQQTVSERHVNSFAPATKAEGTPLEIVAIGQRGSPFDLMMTISESGSALTGTVQYNTDLFDASTIDRLVNHFQILLHGCVRDPNQNLAHLPLLTESERSRILMSWNDTKTDNPEEHCLHELFEIQAQRTPEAIALSAGDLQMTYRQLDRRSNELALHLQTLGIEPGKLVGIYMRRSFDLFIAILGVLRAGGAYVPLDLSYPEQMLVNMLKDTDVPVLLTQEDLMNRVPDRGAKILCVDRNWDRLVQNRKIQHPPQVRLDDLAYVLFTSGSTGMPKGVMVTHRGLVNYLSWAATAYDISNGQGSVLHTPISFDLTVTTLFLPLLAGQRVAILPENLSMEGLVGAFRVHRDLSFLKVTPAHLTVLNQLLPAQEIEGLTRTLIVGGDLLLADHLAHWQSNAPDMRIVNEYGPTEATVGCCAYEVPKGKPLLGSVPIGRPIANTQIYLLDSYQQPVPIGVSGELYIGGAGLARGYIHRSELTAVKFILNPFSEDPDDRLYATGDLARFLPDGNIEFLGRVDHQVKLQGFRIEPGEVEAALTKHSMVREAVVIARGDGNGEKQLAGYLALEETEDISVSDLRNFLLQRLPAHMVPSTFIFLESMPLTPNGKVDRRALPAPKRTRPKLKQALIPPQNLIEKQLAEICAQTLGIDQVGTQDNFFELGGASIKSLEYAGRAAEIGIPLTPELIFQHQTIAELAAALEPVAVSVDGRTEHEDEEKA